MRYPLSEVSVSGARAAGVKAVNLKDDDHVSGMILGNDDTQVGIVTQRGAFKRMKTSSVPLKNRAIRGIKILRTLKTKPHKLVLLTVVDSDTVLEIKTDQQNLVKIPVADHPLADQYSNGSFVLDVDSQGTPSEIVAKIKSMNK